MRYYENIEVPGLHHVRFPWPMTTREAVGYLVFSCVVSIASLAVVIWVSVVLIEPSLWRLAPAIVWAFVLRYVVFPAYRRSIMPRDLDRRRASVAQDR